MTVMPLNPIFLILLSESSYLVAICLLQSASSYTGTIHSSITDPEIALIIKKNTKLTGGYRPIGARGALHPHYSGFKFWISFATVGFNCIFVINIDETFNSCPKFCAPPPSFLLLLWVMQFILWSIDSGSEIMIHVF